MNKKIKFAFAAVAAGVMASSLHASNNNGDLLIGFTDQVNNDVVYDLGQASALTDGESWNLNSLLASYDLTTVNWGVIGTKKISGTGNAWTTTAVGAPAPAALNGNASWAPLDTCQDSIIQYLPPVGSTAGNPVPGASFTIAPTADNSWNQQTISGTLVTAYHNAYSNPNVVGLTSDSFYQVVATNSAPVLLGRFSLAANGVVTYNVTVSGPPAPKILSVTRVGTTTTIFFTTTNTYTYSLYYTNSLGLNTSVTNWPKSITTVTGPGSGLGSTNQLTDTTTDSTRFYQIGAQ